MGTCRRWYSAQAGKPYGRAGDAAEHRDSENDTFHHGALLLTDKRPQLIMVPERRHAREGIEPYASLGRRRVTDTRRR